MSRFLSRIFPAALAVVASFVLAGCSSGGDSKYSSRRAVIEELRELQESNVVLIVSASNRVMLNGTQVEAKALPEEFAAIAKVHPERPVVAYFQVGTDAKAETFVRRQAEKAGLGNVTITWLD